MPFSSKTIAERLKHCLDETGAPAKISERANILSKLLDISKQQAWSLLEGHLMPDNDLIDRVASEFEVDADWLAGTK